MSLRQWNSVSERARLDCYTLISEMLLEEEAIDDTSSSESSMEGMEINLDQEISFLTDIEDEEEGDDEDDAMSIDVVGEAVQ
jgi:hypothetical protein